MKRVRQSAGRQRCALRPGVLNRSAMGALAVLCCLPATAQEAAPVSRPQADAAVYEPAFFARFAPKTAADMVLSVPGFSISQSGQERGFGQARENVLINGRRVSGKSNGALSALSRIAADDVVRIEIVDGAGLGIPGLSGQVANVVVAVTAFSGSWAWHPEFSENTGPSLARGSLSASGATDTGWSWSARLDPQAFGVGQEGTSRITAGTGEVTDVRQEGARTGGDAPSLSGSLTYEAPDGAIANLNLTLSALNVAIAERSFRNPVGQTPLLRLGAISQDRRGLELGADYAFDLGPGRLRLIGLQRLSEDTSGARVETWIAGGVAAGQSFLTEADAGESIVRGEYDFTAFDGEVQIAAEGAFNVLDLSSGLGLRQADGTYLTAPLEDGTARVEERRVETSLSLSRGLAEGVSLQSSLGVEYSQLRQTGAGGLTRQFVRPKGFLALALRPQPDLDVSLKLERSVGQLDFSDFLASVDLQNENAQAGNARLVPEQSWIASAEISRALGPWGALTLSADYRLIEDVVDQIPVGPDGSGVGNIDHARAWSVSASGVINLDPLGLKGVQADIRWSYADSRLSDPLTGQARPISFSDRQSGNVTLRWDIPGTMWTLAGGIEERQSYPGYRLDEVTRSWQSPSVDFFVIEHKDVFGLKMRLEAINLGGVSENVRRDVYEDGRRTAPLAFSEERQRGFGRIMRLYVSGAF